MTISNKIFARVKELREDIAITHADMAAKDRRRDRHGVRDAVVDIEIAEAKIAALEEVLTWITSA